MSALDKVISALTPPESEEKRREARLKARQAAAPGDWLSLILDHHEAIERAFADVKAAPDAGSRRLAEKKLGALLNGHSMAEEITVYPALARIHESGHADMAYTQQAAAKLQTAALEFLDPMSQEYMDKLGHLEGAVLHHVFEEEHSWFLDLQTKASVADKSWMLERYTEEFDRYMGHTAPGLGREPRSFAAGDEISATRI